MKHYEVVAAVIRKDGRFLCVQRGKGKYDYISYKFEFPGGKVELGESKEQALVREIKEELDLQIDNLQEMIVIDHCYPDFRLTMTCFLAECDKSEPTLKEHLSFQWLPATELHKLDWAAADIPAVNKLIETNE
ncbi:MAG: (deoxy)nucleoside triphosphate pyrophosphohydrolase [Chitinophagaceae bacterium]|nr:MAG: (deoxy)nucleoside triphosphate pyrophosphohydrolase [Chitinophagaceae bacterium]